MSSIEKNSNDILPFVYTGALGLVTLGIGVYFCLKPGNKKSTGDTDKELNYLNNNEEPKQEEQKESKKKKKRQIKQKKKMKKK